MTTPKSAAERKRTQRENMRKNGFVPVESWVHKEDVKLIKALELELKTKRIEENKMKKIPMSGDFAVFNALKHFMLLSEIDDFESTKKRAFNEIKDAKTPCDLKLLTGCFKVSTDAINSLQKATVVIYENELTVVSKNEAKELGYSDCDETIFPALLENGKIAYGILK